MQSADTEPGPSSVQSSCSADLAGDTWMRMAKYSAAGLPDDVIRMETGLPDQAMFKRVAGLVERFEGSIVYFAGWKVEGILLADQVFMAMMKIRQNYPHLHLAQLFHCSTATERNVVNTMVHLLHRLLFKKMMSTVPSRQKKQNSMPAAFQSSAFNCRMIVDCTDIHVAAPSQMDQAKLMYSTYRGMHSFKVLISVAPNGVINFCSQLFPGSVSDKAIMQHSGILEHLVAGDLILADKGFLISDIVPAGVNVNIPPFLNKGKFTESEVIATREIAKNRIHVERANARIKEFKILDLIPCHLRNTANVLVQLCCALVNLQTPLIKEVASTLTVD
ncbi:uncharacterized protein [Pseudochaenichthys georgianus]|uniref:uncharacterized protein n=1 Tax=Pseudochaenichthys georgianus TaxID=52239 RepID=UPI00146A3B37|nr:uncharacterized protein LOC117462894 [Pseudochaenichthys georgianus]